MLWILSINYGEKNNNNETTNKSYYLKVTSLFRHDADPDKKRHKKKFSIPVSSKQKVKR